MRNIRGIAVALWLGLAAACAGNRSSVQSGPYQYDNPNRYPVKILGVDGKLFTTTYIDLEPGGHTFWLSPDFGAGKGAVPVTIELNVAPCTRYYLAAETDTSVSLAYTVVVDRTIPIEGCKSKLEQKKEALEAEAKAP